MNILFFSGDDDSENVDQEMVQEMDHEAESENISAEERQIIDRYNLNDYDDEDDTALNHSELVVFADNTQDPYLNNEDAFSDVRQLKDLFCKILIFEFLG